MNENQQFEQCKSTFCSRIFRKKSADELLDAASKHGLKKTLNAFDLTVLGIGAIIGAGIFTLAGTAAAGSDGHVGAGPGLMLSFIFAGLACALAALCYAEFAAMIPVAGSAYTYTFATLGEIAAWLIGWILLLEYAIGNITVACGWSGYLFQLLEGFERYLPSWLVHPPVWLVNDYTTAMAKLTKQGVANPESFFPHIGSIPISFNLPALLIIAVIVSFLYKGVQESTKMAGIMVAVKMVVILLFIGIGVFHIQPSHWTPFLPNGFHGVFVGAFLVFFAYIGFDAVSTAAEETKNPQRNLPIGIIASLAVCTLLYIAVAAVLTGIVPWNTIDTHAPVAAAMRSIGQNWIAGFISIGAVAGLTSVLLVMQLGATRIMFAMSRDKLLPGVFSKLHPKFNTPHIVTVVSGLFVAIGTIFFDLNKAAELCNIGTLSAFLIVCLGVIILRVVEPERKRHFKVPAINFPFAVPVLSSLVGASVFTIIAIAMTNIFSMSPAIIEEIAIVGALIGFVVGIIGKVKNIAAIKSLPEIAIPLFGILTCSGLIVTGVPQRTLEYFALWLLFGLAIYFGYGYRKNREQNEFKKESVDTDVLDTQESVKVEVNVKL